MLNDREMLLMEKLALIHTRVNQIANEEARSTLVKGWAARGGLLDEKERLLQRTDETLKELMGRDDA